ncbi:di-trans,poly-cis-decaprenylcistransferase [Candidatus Roizmanbacteria bacterium]|nr:di-trans,poly-cis-decaprenylcistransferase [Candidatus Roizmanbacteria bacterium]
MAVPKHVAIILDGNRRWAREKGLPTFEGHRRGFNAVVKIGEKARELGIKIVTLWFFSTENFDRSEEEKGYLWKLFEEGIKSNLKTALKEQIRIIHIGRKDRIPKRLKDKIIEVEKKTKDFNKYYLVIALDYGGKDDILRGINKFRENFKFQISRQSRGSSKTANFKLNEQIFSQFLDTKDLPQSDVDLVIRTGGEVRTSGFMIWQAAYAEYIFVKKYLPDFTPQDFENCIKEYQRRQRRFGK